MQGRFPIYKSEDLLDNEFQYATAMAALSYTLTLDACGRPTSVDLMVVGLSDKHLELMDDLRDCTDCKLYVDDFLDYRIELQLLDEEKEVYFRLKYPEDSVLRMMVECGLGAAMFDE